MTNYENKKLNVSELIKNAPKTLNRDFLRQLYSALSQSDLEICKEADSVINSLILMIMSDATLAVDRYLAVCVLQKMPVTTGLFEVICSSAVSEIINVLPIFFIQDISEDDIINTVQKLTWSLLHENLSNNVQRSVLTFLSRIIQLTKNPMKQDEIKKIFSFFPQWMHCVVSKLSTTKSLHRSSSTLSITEVDGSYAQDFFTVLNYTQVTTSEQLLNVQVFSMLKSWLLTTSKSYTAGKKPYSQLSDLISEDLALAVREYCLRIIDQTEKRAPSSSMVKFQKICLIEAISLLDVICRADSGVVHSVLPIIRRIYTQLSTVVLKKPDAHDVSILTACMQFFINHSSSVMHKVDSLYPFLFCDLLNSCYQDNFSAFEIIFLIKENLSQLCYHSSIMEKYFPTFFKVLAWWPSTFSDYFLQLLPACMSPQTSVEVFHTLLDLPCLAAVLVSINTKTETVNDYVVVEPSTFEMLKKPGLVPLFKFVLRKTSGVGDTPNRLNVLHQSLIPLSTHPRVISCAEVVPPLLRCFFITFCQYADTSVAVLLIPAMLERLSLLFDVPNYINEIQKVFSASIIQLFQTYPEAVFHCQNELSDYLNLLSNYSREKECFIHLVWAVGEYVSIAYSDLCRPEVIMLYFQNLETTLYEMISFLSWSSEDLFLKLISVSVSTLAKLGARSQDLLPRAVLCLNKVYKQLSSFDKSHKKSWKIVTKRIIELLAILQTPNVASVVLSPPKDLESGKLHQDATSLPFILRAVTGLLQSEEKPGYS